jgi:AcrR family transcriptional regulator
VTAPLRLGRPPGQGERTREAVLRIAVDVASAEGLEGLTIGRLAAAAELSKSGLFARFGSKQELQLATVEAARHIFVDEVVKPALAVERGLARLAALYERWLAYAEARVFRGGCFFAAAAAEFDGRPGPVRDRVAAANREWLTALERAVREAQSAGHLDGKLEPAQLVFEVNALVMAANQHFQLYGDRHAFKRARAAIAARLDHARKAAATKRS